MMIALDSYDNPACLLLVCATAFIVQFQQKQVDKGQTTVDKDIILVVFTSRALKSERHITKCQLKQQKSLIF